MRPPRIFICAFLLLAARSASAVDFPREVLPVLRRACFECHGADKQKSGLRLDAREHAFKSSDGGTAITPGKPDASELVRRISLKKGDKEVMPNRGELLKPHEIAAIKTWIAEGAVWPENVTTAMHWAYVPPVKSAPPAVKNSAWPRTEIDRFILARLEKEKLAPSPRADLAVLARRVALDVTGLPPSIAMVDAFIKADGNEAAYEHLVDTLLKSDEFGVRWARPWLDLARYADSHGFQRDDLREIWAYRDWVVRALNADMPYDQFSIEQIAGDLLPGATQDQLIATGFNRCTPTNVEAGTDPEESRVNQVLDRVNTAGAVWLGSTLECAQCHNHKYDPFTQRDYYQLLAYFNNSEKEADRTNPDVPGSIQFRGTPLALSDAAKEVQRKELAAKLKSADAEIAAYKEKQKLAGKTVVTRDDAVLPLTITAFDSEGGAESEVQADKSILINGELPDTDTYSVELAISGKQITGLKLEALRHSAIPGGGPGRGDSTRTNFVLHEFEAVLKGADGVEKKLKFDDAFASHSQDKWDVVGAVDGKTNTGWAIAPRFSESHWAVLALSEPLDIAAGSHLSVRMVQNLKGGRSIGCFRISAIHGVSPESVLPEPVIAEGNAPTPKKRRGKAAAKSAVPALSTDPQLAKLERAKAAITKQIAALAPQTTEVMKEMEQPRVSTMFNRGLFTDPGDKVQPATPTILPKPSARQKNRLDLARWLVSRENPLVARVQVNRVWHEIFGQGIVTTVEDFGIKGEPPTHPELLDWLAVDFMESGWSMKRLVRGIVMSECYRQSSAQCSVLSSQSLKRDTEHLTLSTEHFSSASQKDPANSLLWRGPRFRLDAEAIRDNALAAGGLLSLQKGGPSIRPPQPDDLWKKVGGQNYKYEVSTGEAQYRRGIYVVLKRGSPYPSFMNFDASARMACVLRRSRSNTPLQALTLLNDPVFVEAARALAARMKKEAPSQAADARIRHGFRIVLSREPATEEIAALMKLYSSRAANDDTAALEDVATALLNLDEAITKG